LLPSTVTFLDWIWAPEITKEFQDGIQAVVGGKITAEAEMAKIQKIFDDIKAKGYDFDSVK
jgi:raffinose/stachyose/melibiose transport system substrate-binding protein